MRFELMTSSLPRRRSTPELRGPKSQRLKTGAGDEIRTRDPQLGRLMLYQLSYTRPTHFQLPIGDCRLFATSNASESAIGNRKSAMALQGVGFEPT